MVSGLNDDAEEGEEIELFRDSLIEGTAVGEGVEEGAVECAGCKVNIGQKDCLVLVDLDDLKEVPVALSFKTFGC